MDRKNSSSGARISENKPEIPDTNCDIQKGAELNPENVKTFAAT